MRRVERQLAQTLVILTGCKMNHNLTELVETLPLLVTARSERTRHRDGPNHCAAS